MSDDPKSPLHDAMDGGGLGVADWLRAYVLGTASVGHSPSPISELVTMYEARLSAVERAIVHDALLILLRRARRPVASEAGAQKVKDLLFLGAQIGPSYLGRWRTEAGRAIAGIVDANLLSNETEIPLACLNFAVDVGTSFSDSQLRAYAEEIGARSHLPVFLLLSRRSPECALQWLVQQRNGDSDAVTRIFRGGFNTLLRGVISPQVAPAGQQMAALAWYTSSFHDAVHRLPDERLSADLQQVLNEGELRRTEGGYHSAPDSDHSDLEATRLALAEIEDVGNNQDSRERLLQEMLR